MRLGNLLVLSRCLMCFQPKFSFYYTTLDANYFVVAPMQMATASCVGILEASAFGATATKRS
jgi:hypothetical protein